MPSNNLSNYKVLPPIQQRFFTPLFSTGLFRFFFFFPFFYIIILILRPFEQLEQTEGLSLTRSLDMSLLVNAFTRHRRSLLRISNSTERRQWRRTEVPRLPRNSSALTHSRGKPVRRKRRKTHFRWHFSHPLTFPSIVARQSAPAKHALVKCERRYNFFFFIMYRGHTYK